VLHEQPAPSAWATWHGPGLVVSYPRQWHLTPFLGQPATVAFPLIHLSTAPLTGACASPHRAVQSRAGCFDATWPVAAAGVLVGWTKTEFPSLSVYQHAHGSRMAIDGRHAKLSDVVSADGTRTIIATIAVAPTRGDDVMVMTAQIGGQAPLQDVQDIYQMLESVIISDR
jgi:hypothetical protein